MKFQACSASVLTATPTATGSSSESTEEYQVTVVIPFPFVVESQGLPSGTYLITARRTTPESLNLRNLELNLEVQVKGWPMDWYPEGEDKVVFHKFRTMYRLTDIHFSHSSINIHFPTITAETWDLTGRGKTTPLIRGRIREPGPAAAHIPSRMWFQTAAVGLKN